MKLSGFTTVISAGIRRRRRCNRSAAKRPTWPAPITSTPSRGRSRRATDAKSREARSDARTGLEADRHGHEPVRLDLHHDGLRAHRYGEARRDGGDGVRARHEEDPERAVALRGGHLDDLAILVADSNGGRHRPLGTDRP